MSVKETQRVTELRFFKEETPECFAKYSAICNLIEMDSDTCFITGMKGDMSRRNFAELVKFLSDRKYKFLLSQRKDGSMIPFGEEADAHFLSHTWWVTDISEVIAMALKTLKIGTESCSTPHSTITASQMRPSSSTEIET